MRPVSRISWIACSALVTRFRKTWVSWLASQIRLRAEIHGDVVAAKRMLLQLEDSLEEAIDVERSFLGRSRAREFEKVLDDTCGAPRLAVGKIQLALAGVIGSFAFAEKFGNTEDRRERIVQFMGDTSEHLPHGR